MADLILARDRTYACGGNLYDKCTRSTCAHFLRNIEGNRNTRRSKPGPTKRALPSGQGL
jgi:hypothetical protein